jgi:hypothetical protein
MTEAVVKWTRNRKDMKQIFNLEGDNETKILKCSDVSRNSSYYSNKIWHSKELPDQNSLYQCKIRESLRWQHFRFQLFHRVDKLVNKFKISDFLSITKNRVSNFYRLVYLCIIFLNVIYSDKIIISVNCDEIVDSIGVKNHYTPTWAVHIPEGDDVAHQVAYDHGMELVGKVSTKSINFYFGIS